MRSMTCKSGEYSVCMVMAVEKTGDYRVSMFLAERKVVASRVTGVVSGAK